MKSCSIGRLVMANDITLNVTDNSQQIAINAEQTDPYYVGAEASVEQTADGAVITCKDKRGTTSAVIYNGHEGEDGNGIASIVMNADYTLTILFTNGTSVTTDSIRGEKGEKGDPGTGTMYFATTAEWAARTDLVSEKDAMYFYTDYKQIGDENIAGIKLGDGLAYVADLPFLDAQMQSHMADTDIHVTAEDRAFWNAKNRGFVQGENLILTDL